MTDQPASQTLLDPVQKARILAVDQAQKALRTTMPLRSEAASAAEIIRLADWILCGGDANDVVAEWVKRDEADQETCPGCGSEEIKLKSISDDGVRLWSCTCGREWTEA